MLTSHECGLPVSLMFDSFVLMPRFPEVSMAVATLQTVRSKVVGLASPRQLSLP